MTSDVPANEVKIVLVFDLELMRPACVLLQAVYGCGHNNGFLQMTFDPDTWLVASTSGMAKIKGTREEWAQAAELSKMEVRGAAKGG